MGNWLPWTLESGKNPLPIYEGVGADEAATVTISHDERSIDVPENSSTADGYDKIKVSIYKEPHFYLGVGESRTVTSKHIILEGLGSYRSDKPHFNKGKYRIE